MSSQRRPSLLKQRLFDAPTRQIAECPSLTAIHVAAHSIHLYLHARVSVDCSNNPHSYITAPI
eukprot:3880066-Rhodomonas_salina.1